MTFTGDAAQLRLGGTDEASVATRRGGAERVTLLPYGRTCPAAGELAVTARTIQAEMALRAWKQSRQKMGRFCVGRKGTVVSLPQCEQVVCVSTFEFSK